MSTRCTKWLIGPIHVFRDVITQSWFIDIGRDSYNRAFEVWPPTLRVLYGGRWLESRWGWPRHPQLRHEQRRRVGRAS